MSSGRALKPALSLRPSSANRPGAGSRASSQGSLRSLSRSCTPTPSPSANSAAADARCYFSIPSAASAATSEVVGGGPKRAAPARGGTSTLAHFAPANESPKRIPRSRPIAIDAGPATKSRGPTDTPPEPLSARGDFHGGYFPFHEIVNRSHTPHPFSSTSNGNTSSPSNLYDSPSQQLTKTEASGPAPTDQSTSNTKAYPQQRGAPESTTSFFGTYTPYGHSVIESPSASSRKETAKERFEKPKLKQQDSFQFTSRPTLRAPPNTSNSAYLSPGGSSMGIAQGKYHPSHYKAPTMSATTMSPAKKNNMGLSSGSPLIGATMGGVNGAQTAEGIKKKLLQYQQDMREQAASAARLQIPNRQPRSPKLLPLGSPGPVTPWELDGEANGYPGFGRAAAGLTAEKR